MNTKVEAFYDQDTYTLSYIVYDDLSKDALIIDPVLNYDFASSKISYESLDLLSGFINNNQLKIHYILETHAHADHLSGAGELKNRYPDAIVAISENITKVQKVFSEILNFKDFNTNGIQFDLLLKENEILNAGTIELEVLFTPGHTPACASFLIDNKLFTGDALFMPDYGTGRCDFPAGSAKDLYHSVHEKIYKLPEDIIVYTGHDYLPNGRELKYESTIKENKIHNIQLKETTSEKEFIDFRNARDITLKAPKLLMPSIQLNINAGLMPQKESNGMRYFKIPIRD